MIRIYLLVEVGEGDSLQVKQNYATLPTMTKFESFHPACQRAVQVLLSEMEGLFAQNVPTTESKQ